MSDGNLANLNESLVFYSSIVGFSILFIIIVICITWYTSTKGDYITNTQDSKDKMTILYEAMSSALGSNWPIVLLMFTIILAVILLLLYSLSVKEIFTVNLSDEWAKKFHILFIFFILLFTLLIIILIIKAYRNKTQPIANYTPTLDSNQKTKQIITIIALVFIVILLLYFFLTYIRK